MHLSEVFQTGFKISAELSKQSPNLEIIKKLTGLELNTEETSRRDSGESSLHTLACELAVRWAWGKVAENNFKTTKHREMFGCLYRSFENMLSLQQNLDELMKEEKPKVGLVILS